MKEFVGRFIAKLHFMILAYGLWGAWVLYDEHSTQLNEITSQLAPIETEIAVNQKKLQEIQEFKKKTNEYRVRVEEVAKSIETAQRQLPSETSDTIILAGFSQDINTLNIKDPTLVPGLEEVSTYYISKDYGFKAKGTYLQFMIFFERLSNATRIFNVKTLKLISSKADQKGRFKLLSAEGVIQAFRFNPDFKVDRGFDKVDPQ